MLSPHPLPCNKYKLLTCSGERNIKIIFVLSPHYKRSPWEKTGKRSFNIRFTIEVECKLLDVSSFNHIFATVRNSNILWKLSWKSIWNSDPKKYQDLTFLSWIELWEFDHHNCKLIFDCTIKTFVQFKCWVL